MMDMEYFDRIVRNTIEDLVGITSERYHTNMRGT